VPGPTNGGVLPRPPSVCNKSYEGPTAPIPPLPHRKIHAWLRWAQPGSPGECNVDKWVQLEPEPDGNEWLWKSPDASTPLSLYVAACPGSPAFDVVATLDRSPVAKWEVLWEGLQPSLDPTWRLVLPSKAVTGPPGAVRVRVYA